jgi:hypothetical protein
MAANGITDVEANTDLDASLPSTSVVDLVTVMGSASAAPTKVSGGSYAAQVPAWAAATAREKHNSAVVTYSGLPAATIVGIDVTRTSGGARSWFIPFASSKVVSAGDSVVFAASGMSFNFANGT